MARKSQLSIYRFTQRRGDDSHRVFGLQLPPTLAAHPLSHLDALAHATNFANALSSAIAHKPLRREQMSKPVPLPEELESAFAKRRGVALLDRVEFHVTKSGRYYLQVRLPDELPDPHLPSFRERLEASFPAHHVRIKRVGRPDFANRLTRPLQLHGMTHIDPRTRDVHTSIGLELPEHAPQDVPNEDLGKLSGVILWVDEFSKACARAHFAHLKDAFPGRLGGFLSQSLWEHFRDEVRFRRSHDGNVMAYLDVAPEIAFPMFRHVQDIFAKKTRRLGLIVHPFPNGNPPVSATPPAK